MKKLAIAAWRVIAVSIVIVFSTISMAQANTPLLDRNLSLNELSHQLKTPDAIAQYMWRHFLFETDQRNFGKDNYWQTPEEFLKNQKGDCNDFATFAVAMLRLNGQNTFVLNIYGDGYGHSIAVFEENGEYHAIDGTNVVRSKASTLKELIQQIYPFWKTAAVVVPDMATKTGSILQTITK